MLGYVVITIVIDCNVTKMTFTKTIYPLLWYSPKLLHTYKTGPAASALICNRYKSSKNNTLTTRKASAYGEVDTNVKPIGEKVKETTKTVSYLGVILLGIGVTGSLIYAVFNELFSSKSPNNVYNKAVKRCLADTRVEDKLGLPITAYGEETRRGRRQHVSHLGFIGTDGRKHLRMKFYLKGSFQRATVHLEMVENDAGDYDYRYLMVEIHDMLQTNYVLEDNRNKAVLDTTRMFL